MICFLTVQVQIFIINLKPVLVAILRNKSPRIFRCSPINNIEHKVCRLPRKQGNATPVWVTGLEHSNHGISSSFALSSAYREQRISQ